MVAAVRSSESRGALGRETVALGVGDVALLAGVILVGQQSHGVNPLTEPLAALGTLVPFLVGWLVMGALAGAYASDVTTSVAHTARVTTIGWVAAANVGLILRASSLFDGGASGLFPLVITGTGLLVLVGWRVAYTAYAGARS